MDIDRESGKEKVSHGDEDQEKMEKFFALVRNIREARDYIINENQNKRRKIEEEKLVAIAWNPSFQPEDFLEEIKQLNKSNSDPKTLVAGRSSQSNEKGNEEIKQLNKSNSDPKTLVEGGLGLLDLNLPPE